MSSHEFSEEELRAIEAEMEKVTVDDVLLQTIVTLLNLAARRAGLAAPEGQEPKRDVDQLRQAIEGARALLPLVEERHGDKLAPVRDTLARLQMVYAQIAREGTSEGPAAAQEPGPPKPGESGPAQRSGRLWVPGQ
jgi:hypothetical protein